MRSVVVFFDAPAPDGYPFDIEEYRRSYRQLATALHSKGATLFVARGMQSYQGGGCFSSGWVYEGGELLAYQQPIQADVVYNKGHFVADEQAVVVNDSKLDVLCTDKQSTRALFPDLSPRSFVVADAKQLDAALAAASTEWVVAKPVDGEGGAGVYIGPKAEVRARVSSFPYLLEEFIDTAQGIPGIVSGSHDFRMICIRGTLIQAFIRTPPPGGLLPNVAQGGSTHEVPLSSVPASARTTFELVDAKLTQFTDRVYSIDLGLARDGSWKLFELNARPALFARDRGAGFGLFHDALVEVLLTARC